MKLQKSSVFEKAEVINNGNYFTQLLEFVGIFICANVLESIVLQIAVFISLYNKISIEEIEQLLNNSTELTNYIYGNDVLILVSLFSTISSIIVSIIYCTKHEKRTIESMGIKKQTIFKNYLIGLIVGFIMITLVVILEIITGSLKFNGLNSINITILFMLIMFLIGFLIQSASEEIMTRGYLLTSLGAKHKISMAILSSSLVFGLMHILNAGFSIIPLLNITLIGIFFSLYYICFDNIWGVCAMHGIWNFSQGNIYGISVSGIDISNSIFSTTQVVGKEIINGGSFGAEGGLITTFVILLSISILLFYMYKNNKITFK